MKKLTYKVQFETPAFIGGADLKKADREKTDCEKADRGKAAKKAELRPASFIGILRWWWRVILATFYDSSEKIHEKESLIFGSSKRAGAVYLRLLSPENLKRCCGKEIDPYMFANRECIAEGTSFNVCVYTKKEYEEIVDNLCKLVFCWGSVGYRSRKGVGSLKLIEPRLGSEKEELKLLKDVYWRNILEKVEDFRDMTEKGFDDLPSLKNLKLLRRKLNSKDLREGLKEFREVYRNIRREDNNKTPEYNTIIKNFMQGKEINEQHVRVPNIVFGLPIQYKGSVMLTWKGPQNQTGNNRRASLFLFKVKDNYVYAIGFKSKLLLDGAKLYVKYLKLKGREGKEIDVDLSSVDLFEQAIKALEKGGFEEVKIE
ncbi:type III-B CRISPR module RAMP protein Cmr1 [Thermocrinis minervae]|uniref:CRISPR type III-B/RAMP module RAMP protein Cmr1 n=1 Tax=Thermocrinis minervae TaxID=381751 RepID=A0A1M6QTW1_9AQUI|nr:type III-B CRISPR module RAMP protein Cmr1 [Thermocrinis minervae]SHK23664.1 CRISPR type III-B/RAMP module RAMP protein Cmr1 [Thermocrinis minervae]